MKKVLLSILLSLVLGLGGIFSASAVFSQVPTATLSSNVLSTAIIAPPIIITPFPFLPCVEQDSGNLDIEAAKGKVGQMVTIPVRVQSAPGGVASFGMELTYPAGILKYSSFEKGQLMNTFTIFDVSEISSGTLKVGGLSLSGGFPKGSNGCLVRLTFEVIGGADDNCYSLKLASLKDDIANFSQTGGCFCIASCDGDINEDGQITPLDALMVFQCYLGTGTCSECSDVNGDGETTPADALCVFKKYMNQPSCLDEPTSPPLTVVYPTGTGGSCSQEYSIDNQNHLVVTVKFNKPVDTGTVIVGKTLILDAEKDHNAGGTITWSSDHKELTFRTTKTAGDLLIFDPDGFFKVRLVGTNAGQGVIKDTDGKALDGDNNGTYGGNREIGFCLIG